MFKLEIDTSNAAFADDMYDEIAYVLRQAYDNVRAGYTMGNLHDSNGNTVGSFKLS